MSDGAPPPATPAELRALARRAADADDRVLRSLVATLDGIENRGEVDRVLDPVRHRLRTLRPSRPIGFTRLLFLPVEGVIVPVRRWRRDGAQIPRSVLPALGLAIRSAMGEEAAALIADARGRSMEEAEAVASLGARLWPQAATLLPAAAPPGWAEATGLTDQDYPPIAKLCSQVLAHGIAINAALRDCAEGPSELLAREALSPLAEAGPAPLQAGLATLLRHAAMPGRVLAATASLGRAGRAIALPMLGALLEQPLPALDAQDLREAADSMAALALRLKDLEDCGLLDSGQRRRLRSLRHEAEAVGQARLRTGCARDVLQPLQALSEAHQAIGDEEIAAIEATARELRALALAMRRLESEGAPAERLLQAATPQLIALAAGGAVEGPTPMDIARIVEILDGPEAAAAILSSQR